jgi:phosphoribosylaminoimidazolecarboxamide formyltransferase/IMP cyclohydrolase
MVPESLKEIKTALVSVSDKTNLDTLAEYFKKNGVQVVSTGGTYNALKDYGVEVLKASEQTGFPEVMGGRVKTLHPKIHMALLARGNEPDDMSLLEEHRIKPFDLLVVNLYPFKKKREEGLGGQDLAEFIDVGGPSMIRAGAKNFDRIVTLTSPKDYSLLESKEVYDRKCRKRLAGKAFQHLSEYDSQIYQWLLETETTTEKSLRYGENPHQSAKWVFQNSKDGLHQSKILQGKELSFNNLVDLTAAVESLHFFKKPTVVSVKHNNPCGIGESEKIEEALKKSLSADPLSVFGGIVALNRELNATCAHELVKMFLECIAAPSVSPEAKEILAKKKNLRVLEWATLKQGYKEDYDYKRVSGGQVIQDVDPLVSNFKNWKQVSGEQADKDVISALEFSWKAVGRLKSNAIAVCGLDMTLGLGMGQVNRVDAVKSSIERWRNFHPNHKGPVVLASDAFFPFKDSLELISEAGIKWVVQPGGSIKDDDVVNRAKELEIGMFFTGERHFLH